jgi:hypothetical protein
MAPPPATEPLERAFISLVIGSLLLFAIWFDAVALHVAWNRSLLDVARGGVAVALGWILGWYLTCRFEPTHNFLAQVVLGMAGYLVAAVGATTSFFVIACFDLFSSNPERSSYLAITATTFAPVASLFTTRIDPTRSVHVVAGLGIGAFSYIVLFGFPD